MDPLGLSGDPELQQATLVAGWRFYDRQDDPMMRMTALREWVDALLAAAELSRGPWPCDELEEMVQTTVDRGVFNEDSAVTHEIRDRLLSLNGANDPFLVSGGMANIQMPQIYLQNGHELPEDAAPGSVAINDQGEMFTRSVDGPSWLPALGGGSSRIDELEERIDRLERALISTFPKPEGMSKEAFFEALIGKESD